MEGPSPARLYATVVGAALLIFGIAGFFQDASFARPDGVREALGPLAVNGWANVVHMATGALGLLLAGFASRPYALGVTLLYGAVAVSAALS